jgi:hypothetical protein
VWRPDGFGSPESRRFDPDTLHSLKPVISDRLVGQLGGDTPLPWSGRALPDDLPFA